MLSRIDVPENRQGAKNAKKYELITILGQPPGGIYYLGAPAGRFAKQVGVKTMEPFFVPF
jgi:hypothetical protein